MNPDKSIRIHDLFDLSIGEVAILEFPDGEYPKIGMILNRNDGAKWKIVGTELPRSSDMTNAYKHFDPPIVLYSCALKAQNEGKPLSKGDILFQ